MSENIIYEAIFERMTDLLFVMSATPTNGFQYTKMNSAAMRATGLNEFAYGAAFKDVVERHEADVLQSQYSRAVRSRQPVSFVLSHDGMIGESILSPVFADDGRCQHVFGTVRDITAHFHREERLKQQAYLDALTGLPNRYSLESSINTAFAKALENSTPVAVCVIDVDNLKSVNDTYGHIIGDLYLQNIGARLKATLRDEDHVSRFGGDEFVIAANMADELSAIAMAERLLQVFRAPWLHEDVFVEMSVSIGIAMYPFDGRTVWEVVRAADEALYDAKHQGGNRYVFTHRAKLTV